VNRRRILLFWVVGVIGVLAVSCGGPTSTPIATSIPTTAPSPIPPTSTPVPTATESVIEPTEVPSTPIEDPDPVKQGQALAARFGCAACHSADGSPKVGPTWKGLFGSEENLTDGSTAIVDAAFVIESILDPDAKITQGFTANIMPKDFGEKLSDSDIDAIIAYLKSLK
jgi:mono/diheme cytochrome c family protein